MAQYCVTGRIRNENGQDEPLRISFKAKTDERARVRVPRNNRGRIEILEVHLHEITNNGSRLVQLKV